jgi:hypothetical protein
MNTEKGIFTPNDITKIKTEFIKSHNDNLFNLIEYVIRNNLIKINSNNSIEDCVFAWINNVNNIEVNLPIPSVPFDFAHWKKQFYNFKTNVKLQPNTPVVVIIYINTCESLIAFIERFFRI